MASPDGTQGRDAFISYSQQRDDRLAEALQKGLQRLALPRWRLARMDVFRDVTSLHATHDLTESIRRELARSRYLILLASPEAAGSRWVAQEIEFWLSERSVEHLLIAVARGEIHWDQEQRDFDWERTTALPRQLAGRFTAEPLWVDLRQITEDTHRSLQYAAFRSAVAALAAPLHGRPKEELDSEDVRNVRLARRLRNGAIVLLTALLLVVSGLGLYARDQRDEAVNQAHISASQALSARSGQLLATSPNQAAQFALYADEVRSTPESRRALALALAAAPYAKRQLRADSETVTDREGGSVAPATHVVFSADGSTFAYDSDFDDVRGIRIYDARSTRQRGLVQTNGGPLALSRDGRVLATQIFPNRVQLWDTRTGKLRRTVATGHTEGLPKSDYGLGAFAFSPDGRWLAATHIAPEDQTFVVVWEASTGREVSRRRTGGSFVGLGFDRNANRLVMVDTERREVRDMTPYTGGWGPARPLPGLPGSDQVVLFDGARKALIQGPERAEIWDLEERRRVAARSLGAYAGIAVADDGASVVVGYEDGTIRQYDAALRPGVTLGRLARPVSVLATPAGGARVAAASYGGELTLFTPGSRRGEQVALDEEKFTPGDLTPDGRAAVRRDDYATYFWDAATGRELGQIPYAAPAGQSDSTPAYAVSGDKRHVAVQGMANGGPRQLSIWDLRTGERKCAASFAYSLPHIDSAPFYLPGDRYVVSVVNDGVRLFDTRDCSSSWVKKAGQINSFSITLSGDRRTLVVLDGVALDTWRWNGEDAFTHVGSASLPEGSDEPQGVGVDHDGTRAAFSVREGDVYVVDLTSGKRARIPGSLSQAAADVAFSRDGEMLVQSFQNTRLGTEGLRIWDIDSGDLLDAWTMDAAPPDDSGRLAPPPQIVPGPGSDLLTLRSDGKVVRRAFGVAEWRRSLCALVSEPLSGRELARYLPDLEVSAPCG